ncbi:COG4315 family predicted lipoprotein [Salinirussus salinus]|jgi:predicted lipoprotein with Yx(FWY)xxD motif|uniref:COG4315 family predicted lipoprotein n=1 Tax=Salinirussus salinus TaxID=1198300 RepID=UPI00135A9A53|nr:hypothetical protein [Salinirussus salinus]
MRPTRRAVLGAAVTVGIAGCLGGPGDGDGESGDSGGMTPAGTDEGSRTATGSPVVSTATDGSATVQVRMHERLGPLLAGPDGLTLYMFDRDTQEADASACSGGCADVWPPLTADGTPTRGEDVTATVGSFERASGDRQVTAGGWPLYYYASDGTPGDAAGQGVNDVWWVLDPAGTPVRPTATETAGPGETTDGGSVGY